MRFIRHSLGLASIPFAISCIAGCGSDDTLLVTSTSDGGASTDAIANDGISIDTSTLDFGAAECGGNAPQSKVVHIANAGANAIHWNVALSGSTLFSTPSQSSASIAPGDSADITVSAAAMPASESWGTVERGLLSIFTDDPAHFQTSIDLKMHASGASLVLSKSSIDFGEVPLDTTSSPIDESIKNVGDEPVTLGITAPGAPFGLTWSGAPAAITLAPLASSLLTATFQPTLASSATANVSMTTSAGHVCGGVPSVAAHGVGTSGAIALQPGAIDFGYVDCGTTSSAPLAERTVTITNTGNVSMTWAATLRRGSQSFYDLTTTGTTLAAGASGTIVVAPHAIPSTSSTSLDYYGDGIIITTDVSADVPHLVELHETAHGAILTVPATVEFPHGSVGKKQTSPLRIRNVGNASIELAAPTVTGGFGVEGIGLSPLAPSQSVLATITLTPEDTSEARGSFTPTTFSGVFCAAIPSSTLVGDVDEPEIFVPVAAFDYGAIACGATPPVLDYTIENNTDASVDFMNLSPSHFAIDPNVGTLAASATQPVSAQATDVALPGNQGPDGQYQLLVWAHGATYQSYSLPIGLDVRGAQLDIPSTVSLGAIPVGSERRIPFLVGNDGTAPAGIETIAGGNGFAFDPMAATLLPGDSALIFARFTPSAVNDASYDAAVEPTPATVTCPFGPAARPLQATASGVSNGVVVSPTYVDLGRAPCGSPAQPVGIANHGSTAFEWTEWINGSPVFGDTLQPNSATMFEVDPSDWLLPPGELMGTIEITTNVPEDSTHEVAVIYNYPGSRPPLCP